MVACLRSFGKQPHGADKLIEALLRFRLGWLHKHRARDDEREVDRHRVKALVDQRLREVERRDVRALQEAVVEERFVHAGPLAEGIGQAIAQAGPHVVRVKSPVIITTRIPAV